MRTRPTLPAGHGELLTQPDVATWPELIERNRRTASTWEFTVAGTSASALRDLARSEALATAELFSVRLGVPVKAPAAQSDPIVMTGHQPELYHPGIWAKCFLMQRVADETGASAIDLVVDSDGFDAVAITSPCLKPEVMRCRQYLALGSEGACFATAPVPSERDVEDFCAGGRQALETLPAPSITRHFGEFCVALRSAAHDAENLAETVTFARRRYEARAGTDYLELPLTALARSAAFARFVVDLASNAGRFANAYNAELAEYRAASGTRSAAQPFPDLRTVDGSVELPFWLIADGRRSTLWARPADDGVSLVADGDVAVALCSDDDESVDALLASGAVVAPKALALTMFARLFACDLFIHGVGGGRYDSVTDGVVRRYFGIEAPAFAVASLTLYLPLGAHVVSDEEVAQATERLNRFEHNPDALLGEIEFEGPEERERAAALVADKAALVAAIALSGADKKAIASQIRDVNAQLSVLLQPVRDQLAADLERLTAQREVSYVLTDRGYPFCFWDPLEVADKVR